MLDILYAKLAKRGIDLACAEAGEAEVMAKTATQSVIIREGIEAELGQPLQFRNMRD